MAATALLWAWNVCAAHTNPWGILCIFTYILLKGSLPAGQVGLTRSLRAAHGQHRCGPWEYPHQLLRVALKLLFTLAYHMDKGPARMDLSLTRTSMPKSYRWDCTHAGFLLPATKVAAELECWPPTEHLLLAALHSHSHCWAPVLLIHAVTLRPRGAPVLSRLADA